MSVLVTRPLPDGERTAATLRARGYDVLLAPLMVVRPVPADLSGEWAAVIITSAHAVRVLNPQQLVRLAKLPLYAVGERSAEAAREAGFKEVHSADADADALIRLICERARHSGSLLYLAGEDRAADIEAELDKRGIKARTVVIYKNITSGFSPELIAALRSGTVDTVLHFSRRSAENYINGATEAGVRAAALTPRQLCLSAQIAEPLQGDATIAVAAHPDEASLLALLPPARP
jgi:uroporphyrinogen-III synthase